MHLLLNGKEHAEERGIYILCVDCRITNLKERYISSSY